MKKQTLGIIIGIALSSAIATFIEFYVFSLQCCDCGRLTWTTHQSVLMFLIFFLILIGLFTNFITKTKGVFKKLKEGAIVGFVSSLICFFVLFIMGLPSYTQFNDLSLLDVLSDFPILLFIPLFIGCIVLGSLLLHTKESIMKTTKNKAILSIVLVLILTIIPIWINVSLANEEHELNSGWICDWQNTPDMAFDKNAEDMTLTLTAITVYDLYWEDFQVSGGNATLPNGTIGVGDVITNCSQEGNLVWITCDMLIYHWDFN